VEIDAKLVEYLAQLCSISLSEEEKISLRGDLQKILSYFERINALDTSQVQVSASGGEQVNVFREDRKGAGLPQDEALKNAPDRKGNFFKAPPIIER
jgi:aspartyl-tRNA(Asn)/glutamyl-tRNA(Gln) amidotransferase subunit C